jgi:protein-S-isoprenylcysteine O-methyltransferase Ste14
MKCKITKDTIWVSILTVLGIACFPANPLVFSGAVNTPFYLPAFIVGWVFWAGGMVLVMAPIIQFPRKGGVPRGKSFPNTTRLVTTGIYAVVRHPQYLGGIPSIFITCVLWYPHWLFGVLGAIGIAMIYLGMIE